MRRPITMRAFETHVLCTAAERAARAVGRHRGGRTAVAEAMERRVLLSAGTLDSSFGSSGVVTLPSGGGDSAGVAVQSNNDVIDVRQLDAGPPTQTKFLVIERRLPSGALDSTFNDGPGSSTPGQLVVSEGSNALATLGTIPVIVQTNGNILVAANELLRVTPAGTLDGSFGLAGEVKLPAQATSLAVQADGGILVGDTSATVSRYTFAGKLDTSYGSGGHFTFAAQPEESDDVSDLPHVGGIAVTPGGNAIISVGFGRGEDDAVVGVARLTSNGQLDTAFGNDSNDNFFASPLPGFVLEAETGNLVYPQQVAIASTGVIYEIATYDEGGGFEADAALYAFSPDGKQATPTPSMYNTFDLSDLHGLWGMAVQPDGKPVVVGYGDSQGSDDGQGLAIERFLAETPGTTAKPQPDPTFGTNGLLILPADGDFEGGGIAVEGDEKIVVANSDIVARINGDASTFGSISGTVFNDTNGDGVENGSETGLAGRVVYVDVNNDTTLDAGEPYTTTAADGSYTLSDVPAGAQTVRQILPTGTRESYPTNAGGQHVTVSSSATATGVNFGSTAAAYVSGTVATAAGAGVANVTVYLDANNDSKLDNGEQSTITSSTGTYAFPGVPAGAYIVRQILPTGDTQTLPTNGYGIHITVTAAQVLSGQNFTDTVPATGATISGIVTNNGSPLAGETIYLDANNNVKFDPGELTTTTLADGSYRFTNLPAGAYIVRQTLPAGVTQKTPSGGLGIHITVKAGQTLTNQNFADTGGTSGGGSVTLANGALTITGTANADTIALSAATDGTLTVTLNGSSQSFQPGTVKSVVVNTLGGNDSVTANGVSLTINAGDGNDTLTTREGDNISVTAGNGNDLISVGNDGSASYDTAPDGVTIVAGSGADTLEGIANDATLTAGNGNDNISYAADGLLTIAAGNGQDTIESDGAAVQSITAGKGNDSISMYQTGDSGGGITVAGGAGTDSITATGIDDNFVLNLGQTSGTDTVSLAIEFPTVVTTGSGSTTLAITGSSVAAVTVNGGAGNDSINVSGGFDNVVIDGGAGINHIAAPSGATITNDVIGTVFDDANGNGVQDTGEAGELGVQVYDDLNNVGSYVSGDPTTTTDASGNYTLDLPAGPAIIRNTPPAGYRQSYPIQTAGQHITIGDNTDTGVSFGDTPSTFIGGKVFNDTNGNGVFDGSDVALSGVTVTLYAGTAGPGSYEASTTTDADGSYSFVGQLPATYTVVATTPSGFAPENPASGSQTFTLAAAGVAASENFAESASSTPVQPTPAKLTGTVIGTPGSYNNSGNTGAKAFDGNPNTYVDLLTADPSTYWTGLDLGTGHVVTQISFTPRSGYANRMVGGVFQGSDSADFSGPAYTLYTITSTPVGGPNTVNVSNPQAFRYVRYLGPAGSHGDVAEIVFTGYAPAAAVTFSNGQVVVYGTNGNDTITATISEADTASGTAAGSYGASILLNGASYSFSSNSPIGLLVDALGGNDSITETYTFDSHAAFAPATLLGGDGNDTVVAQLSTNGGYPAPPQPSVFVDGGAGDDEINVEGDGSTTLNGGDGSDSIFAAGDISTTAIMNGDEGDDTLDADEDASGTLNGGAGDDTLIDGDVNNTLVVSGGDGTDTFQLGTVATTATLSLDGKPDSNLGSGGVLTLNTDVENVTVAPAFGGNVGTSLVINGDSSANNIDVGEVDGFVTVNSGEGNDTIEVDGDYATVTAGAGNDSVTLLDTADASITAGNGNDTLDIDNTGGSDLGTVNISIGNGNDSVTAGDANDLQGVILTAGNGDDTISVSDLGSNDITTGTGNNSILVDADVATVNGGTGNDSVTFYGGELSFSSTGGNDMIDSYAGPDGVNLLTFGNTGNDSVQFGSIDSDPTGEYAKQGNVTAGDANLSVTGYVSQSDISLGNGHDAVDLFSPLSSSVRAGNGGDFVTLESKLIHVTTGSGNDMVRVINTLVDQYNTANQSAVISTGAGNDTVYANDNMNDTIDGGSGSDTAYIDPPGTVGAANDNPITDTVSSVENVYQVPYGSTYLTGTYIGTAGSYRNQGNVGTKAFDGMLTNYFDGPDGSGDWVGLDLGSAQSITGVGFAPRSGFSSRMVGGMFQASDTVDFSSGVTALYTVTAAPASGVLTTVMLQTPVSARYVRYIGPAGSNCNVGEVEFLG